MPPEQVTFEPVEIGGIVREVKGSNGLTYRGVPVPEVKTVDRREGVVEALVSVTNVEDNVQDIILPGAYEKTLRVRKPKGVWNHSWDNWVAKTLSCEEFRPGHKSLPAAVKALGGGALHVVMQFNLKTQAGHDAYENVKFFDDECEFSIGYQVPGGGATYDTKSGIRSIRELALYEYSPVLFGAMSLARPISVKSMLAIAESKGAVHLDELELKHGTPGQPGYPHGESRRVADLKPGDRFAFPGLEQVYGEGPTHTVVGMTRRRGQVVLETENDKYRPETTGHDRTNVREFPDDREVTWFGTSDFEPGHYTGWQDGKFVGIRVEDDEEKSLEGKHGEPGDPGYHLLHPRSRARGSERGGKPPASMRADLARRGALDKDGNVKPDRTMKPGEAERNLAKLRDAEARDAARVNRRRDRVVKDRAANAKIIDGQIVPNDPKGDKPVVCETIEQAIDELGKGNRVELRQRREVSTLLDRLVAIVKDAESKGEKAPTYDLCKVTVKNTNLFCSLSKGIPRVRMPQLSGIPEKGSKADKLEKDKRGEVNLASQFIEHLRGKGVKVKETTEKASYLRASQNELNGAKVAGIAKAMREGKVPKGSIFVSADNYVVDGHHRWAATVGNDLADNREGDLDMDINQVDMPILEVLAEANKFAAEWGIPQAGIGSGFGRPDEKKSDEEADAVDVSDLVNEWKAMLGEAEGKSLHTHPNGELHAHPETAARHADSETDTDAPAQCPKCKAEMVDADNQVVDRCPNCGWTAEPVTEDDLTIKAGNVSGAALAHANRELREAVEDEEHDVELDIDFGDFDSDELEAIAAEVRRVLDFDDRADVMAEEKAADHRSSVHRDLDRSPKKNWVEKAGGLPNYIERIAKHIHADSGLTISHAIAAAIEQVKKWASGAGNVTPATRAKAAKAVAQWEALKAKAHAKKDVHGGMVEGPATAPKFGKTERVGGELEAECEDCEGEDCEDCARKAVRKLLGVAKKAAAAGDVEAQELLDELEAKHGVPGQPGYEDLHGGGAGEDKPKTSQAKEVQKALDAEIRKLRLTGKARTQAQAIVRRAVADMDSEGGRRNSRSFVSGAISDAKKKLAKLGGGVGAKVAVTEDDLVKPDMIDAPAPEFDDPEGDVTVELKALTAGWRITVKDADGALHPLAPQVGTKDTLDSTDEVAIEVRVATPGIKVALASLDGQRFELPEGAENGDDVADRGERRDAAGGEDEDLADEEVAMEGKASTMGGRGRGGKPWARVPRDAQGRWTEGAQRVIERVERMKKEAEEAAEELQGNMPDKLDWERGAHLAAARGRASALADVVAEMRGLAGEQVVARERDRGGHDHSPPNMTNLNRSERRDAGVADRRRRRHDALTSAASSIPSHSPLRGDLDDLANRANSGPVTAEDVIEVLQRDQRRGSGGSPQLHESLQRLVEQMTDLYDDEDWEGGAKPRTPRTTDGDTAARAAALRRGQQRAADLQNRANRAQGVDERIRAAADRLRSEGRAAHREQGRREYERRRAVSELQDLEDQLEQAIEQGDEDFADALEEEIRRRSAELGEDDGPPSFDEGERVALASSLPWEDAFNELAEGSLRRETAARALQSVKPNEYGESAAAALHALGYALEVNKPVAPDRRAELDQIVQDRAGFGSVGTIVLNALQMLDVGLRASRGSTNDEVAKHQDPLLRALGIKSLLEEAIESTDDPAKAEAYAAALQVVEAVEDLDFDVADAIVDAAGNDANVQVSEGEDGIKAVLTDADLMEHQLLAMRVGTRTIP